MRSAGTIGASALILVIAMFLSLRGDPQPGWEQDEGILLVYPERILEGDVPNADFESLYGPGNLYTLAGVYAIAGVSVPVERAVALGYKLAIVLAVFLIGRRRSLTSAFTAGSIAAVALSLIHLAAFSWLGGVALATWGLYLMGDVEPHRGRTFAAGALLGIAMWFRWDLGPAVVLITAVGVLGRRQLVKPLLSGIAVGAIGYVVHLSIVGPDNMIRGMILDPILHIGPGRRLPLPDPDEWSSRLLLLLAASVVFLLTAGWRAARRGPPDRSLLMAGALSLGLVPQALQRADDIHILFAAVVPIALGSAALSGLGRTRRSAVIQVLTGALVVLFLANGPRSERPAFDVTHEGRSFPVGDAALARDAQLIIDSADRASTGGDRLFVGPQDLRRTSYNDTFLYFMLPALEPASYFLEMNPGSADRGMRLAREIAQADLLILTSRFGGWSEPNASREYGSELANELVAERFCVIDTQGSYRLLVRCARD